jgi:hypothetical protein
MTFNAGSAMVTLDGDARGAVDAFKRVSDAASTFESRAKAVADAVMRTTSRVDELRAKQAGLASALVAAAQATERDEGKVHALRLELEQTTGALNRLTGAQQVSVSVQQKIVAATSTATTAHRGMGGAVLEASRAFEDMQYGIAGVLNNIPTLIMSLGGGMGLAGVLSLVLVAATQVTKHWGDFGKAADENIQKAQSRLDELHGVISDVRIEMEAMARGTTIRIVKQEQSVAAAEKSFDEAKSLFGRAAYDRGVMASVPSEVQRLGLEPMPRPFLDSDKQAQFEDLRKLAAVVDAEKNALYELENQHATEQIQAMEDQLKADLARKETATRTLSVAAEVLTKTQALEAVASMFADVNGAGTKSTASWANPTITPEGANELAEMQSEAEKAIVVISDAAYATADEIDQMNAEFLAAGEVVATLRTPLEQFADGLSAVAMDAAGAAASGNLSGAASMLGSAGGTVIGNAVAPGIGGAIGGGLGSAMGGMLGGMLDQLIADLVESLGVLTPIFDALGVVVGALSPIFMVLGVLADVVGTVLIALSPIIVALSEPIAALALYLVRFVQIAMPFVNIFLLVVSGFMGFFDLITVGTSILDEYFFRPLISGVAVVYNAFVGIYNGVIMFVRGLEIAGKRPFENFGVLMNTMQTYVEDTIGNFPTRSVQELGSVLDDTTDEANELGRSMSNVPSWYRVPLAEYGAADGRGGNGGGGGGGRNGGRTNAAGGAVFNGPVTFVMQDSDVSKAVRKGLMKMRGVVVGGVRRSNDDDSN